MTEPVLFRRLIHLADTPMKKKPVLHRFIRVTNTQRSGLRRSRRGRLVR
jgi:hypothetical protein